MTAEPTKTLKALVAEDEPAMLSLVARHLRSRGFSVIEASEGDVAWSLALEHHPDLILLDVMMPGMSGWEVCKRLKGTNGEGALADTAVIMLTGIGENLNDMTSPLFAADGWLNKPFDFGELDVKINETLSRYGKNVPTSEAAPVEEKGTVDAAEEEPSAEATDTPPSKQRARSTKKSVKRPAKPAAKKATAKPAAKKAAKATAKKAAKPAAKKAAKPAAKKAAKATAKKAAKPAAKKAAKPAAKKAAKPAAKKAAKPAAKKAAKATAKKAAKKTSKAGG